MDGCCVCVCVVSMGGICVCDMCVWMCMDECFVHHDMQCMGCGMWVYLCWMSGFCVCGMCDVCTDGWNVYSVGVV